MEISWLRQQVRQLLRATGNQLVALSINFPSAILMNNYDVNLCITNLKLPNGGVAEMGGM